MNTGDRHGWRKSSLSNNGGQSCVEVRFDAEAVYVRDSKYLRDPSNDPARQPIITIPANRWHEFLDLTDGHTVDAAADLPVVDFHADGGASLSAADGTVLTFTPAEWCAFTAGVHAGEFAAA